MPKQVMYSDKGCHFERFKAKASSRKIVDGETKKSSAYKLKAVSVFLLPSLSLVHPISTLSMFPEALFF